MKRLTNITMGQHAVTVAVDTNAAYPHVLFFEAVCCGKTRIENTMTHQGSHDHSDEQFDKDVADHRQRLAEEAAGKCRSAQLVAKLLGAATT